MKNKILFITNKSPHYRIPLFNELAKNLNIKFVFTHEDKKIKGLKAEYILAKGIGFGKYKIHFSLINILKKEKPSKVVMLPPDPLHLIDNCLIYFYCKINKIPYSIIVGRWEYKYKPFKQKLTEPFYYGILKQADKIIVYGTKSKEWVLSRGIKKNKIIVAYNINPEIYRNLSKKRKKLSQFKNKKVILYVGRLIKSKGVDYLIKAFSQIKDKNSILVLVGGSDYYKLGAKSEETRLKKLVKKLGIEDKVVFIGEVPHDKVEKYYRSADCFVLPSITTTTGEAWGHVIEEAMSFGLPIITTDAVGAAYDLVRNGNNGFIVPEKNANLLREAIEKIL